MQFHPSFAAEFAAEAKRLGDEYSAPLYLSVEPPPVEDDPRTADAFAWTKNQGRFPVAFNAWKFGPYADPAATRAELAETTKHHYSVERKDTDALVHEYGHVLSDQLPRRMQLAFAHDLQQYLRPYATSERRLFSALSKYGVSDPWEAMAEAFVLMDRGAGHPAARIAEKHLGKFRR